MGRLTFSRPISVERFHNQWRIDSDGIDAVADCSSLGFNRSGAAANTDSNAGALTKRCTGRLSRIDTSFYTGAIAAFAGDPAVNGSIISVITV